MGCRSWKGLFSQDSSPTWPPLMTRSAVERASALSTLWRASAAGSASNVSQGSPPSDSNTALRVPGNRAAHFWSAVPTASRRTGLAATTRIPTGVRTPPVDIMSIRARAGAVHALVHPGRRVA